MKIGSITTPIIINKYVDIYKFFRNVKSNRISECMDRGVA